MDSAMPQLRPCTSYFTPLSPSKSIFGIHMVNLEFSGTPRLLSEGMRGGVEMGGVRSIRMLGGVGARIRIVEGFNLVGLIV